MKNFITIIGVNVVAGRSKKTGNDYDMRMAQCIIERKNPETGEDSPLIGELVLPQQFKDTQKGRYEVEFEISVSQDKRVGAQVASMVLVGPKGASVAPSLSAAAPPKV